VPLFLKEPELFDELRYELRAELVFLAVDV
jgi:hypothetical protein